MKKFLLIIIIVTSSCTSYKNLKSSHAENFWSASFENFNGKETLDFSNQKNSILYLSSELHVTKGKLLLLVNHNQISDSNQISHAKFSINKALRLQIEGKNAAGSFALRYPAYEIKTIAVNYNKNIELLCLSNFLIQLDDFENIPDNQSFIIDGKEVKVKDLYALNLKIAKEFKPFLKSKNLETIKSYLDKDFYLHYSNFVLALENFPNANAASDAKFLSQFSSLEAAREFTNAFNNFYNEIDFGSFLQKYKPFYEAMIKEVSQSIPNENFITEMEHFYGKNVENYKLYPSLTMPFSSGFAVGNENTVGNIFGSFGKPKNIDNTSDLKLGFDNSISLRTICLHEFGHSFVNPAIDQTDEKIINSKQNLFDPIKDKMTEQGYNQWKICLYEHFDRANEVIITKLLGDDKKAEEILYDNVTNRSFVYLPKIIENLEFWYYNEYFTKTYDQKVSEIISTLKQ